MLATYCKCVVIKVILENRNKGRKDNKHYVNSCVNLLVVFKNGKVFSVIQENNFKK